MVTATVVASVIVALRDMAEMGWSPSWPRRCRVETPAARAKPRYATRCDATRFGQVLDTARGRADLVRFLVEVTPTPRVCVRLVYRPALACRDSVCLPTTIMSASSTAVSNGNGDLRQRVGSFGASIHASVRRPAPARRGPRSIVRSVDHKPNLGKWEFLVRLPEINVR